MRTNTIVVCAALLSGLALAWIDTRPGWDDTGMIVGLVLSLSFVWGTLYRGHFWVIGLAVGLWIPLANIILTGSFASAVALAVSALGAFTGARMRARISSRS